MSSYFSTALMGCSWKIRSDGGGEEASENRRKSKNYVYSLIPGTFVLTTA